MVGVTLTVVGGPSWVQIDLDTTPPVLVLDAPARVEPPDPWVVLIKANEDLGPVAAFFTDTSGTVHKIGVERITARLLSVVLPTVGLGSGPGELRVVARDRACNATEAFATVVIDRPRAFDVVLAMDTGQEVTLSVEPAFESALEMDSGYAAVLTGDTPFETEVVMDSGTETSLEITRGPDQ